jgi:flagellar FliJ protein
MSRKFALQRVLELKEQVEDMLQTQVAGIEGERLELQSRIDALRSQWADTSNNEAERSPEPLDPAGLQERAEYLEALERRIQSHGQTLDRVQERLQAKRTELETNYKERELLQRLKEKRAAAEDKEEQRRDLRALDDITRGQYLRRMANGAQ